MRWTPEQTAFLREHYASKGVGYCAAALGCTDKQCMAKAHYIGVRCETTMRDGRPYKCPPKRTEPSFVIAAPKRGPAYLDGPLILTDKTRRVVCPSMPQPWRSNTHSMF